MAISNGTVFERLTVVRPDLERSTPKTKYYVCHCTCSKTKTIRSDALMQGRAKSCGCLQKDLRRQAARNTKERFMEKVNQDGAIPEYAPELGKCWEWTSAQDGHGYGVFFTGNTTTKAYRVSYEMFEHLIPTGMELDHKCRVTICVNPAHLEVVTKQENLRRMRFALFGGMCNKGIHKMEGKNIYTNPSTGKTRCLACAKEYSRLRNLKAKSDKMK